MTASLAIALVLSFGVGLSLGLAGSGGSILMLPILVYVLGVSPPSAVATAMVVVGATSMLGSALHLRRGNVHMRAAFLLGGAGAVGAYGGSHATALVAPSLLTPIFGVVMMTAGVAMLRAGAGPRRGERCRWMRCATVGLATGVLTGFLGVGGGFVLVPALVTLAGIELPRAVGTSLAIIGVNAVGGLVGQLRHQTIDWPLTLAVSAPALAGLGVAVWLSGRVATERVQDSLAWGIIVAGLATVAAGVYPSS